MGLIYNNDVEESRIMEAYGLIVYGKVNRYDWTIFNKEPENVLISITIINSAEVVLVNMSLGNNCIFQSNINSTLDNFLYWIATEKPDRYSLEDMVYKCLCTSNTLFNHRIANLKMQAKKKEEEEKRAKEKQALKEKQLTTLKEYCKGKGLFYFIDLNEEVFLLKANTNDSRKILAEIQKKHDNKKMEFYVKWVEKYPENKDLSIVKRATIEEILQGIK